MLSIRNLRRYFARMHRMKPSSPRTMGGDASAILVVVDRSAKNQWIGLLSAALLKKRFMSNGIDRSVLVTTSDADADDAVDADAVILSARAISAIQREFNPENDFSSLFTPISRVIHAHAAQGHVFGSLSNAELCGARASTLRSFFHRLAASLACHIAPSSASKVTGIEKSGEKILFTPPREPTRFPFVVLADGGAVQVDDTAHSDPLQYCHYEAFSTLINTPMLYAYSNSSYHVWANNCHLLIAPVSSSELAIRLFAARRLSRASTNRALMLDHLRAMKTPSIASIIDGIESIDDRLVQKTTPTSRFTASVAANSTAGNVVFARIGDSYANFSPSFAFELQASCVVADAFRLADAAVLPPSEFCQQYHLALQRNHALFLKHGVKNDNLMIATTAGKRATRDLKLWWRLKSFRLKKMTANIESTLSL